jgi:hypothetical protein
MDMVLFIVAADEGVMPQTIEHLEILQLLHAKRGVIVLTKCDLVGCNTGGKVSPPIEDPESVRLPPQSDTLAGTFVSLGVQCVVYAAGSDIASGKQIGPMMDEWASRFWEIATKQSADSVARAVELALKEICDKIKKTGEGRLGMRTTFGIFVVGDTRLY